MKYLYNLTNMHTNVTEYKKITCTEVSQITGESMLNIQRMMRNGEPINGYIATGINTIANVKQTKDIPGWRKDEDSIRWETVCEPFRKRAVNEE